MVIEIFIIFLMLFICKFKILLYLCNIMQFKMFYLHCT